MKGILYPAFSPLETYVTVQDLNVFLYWYIWCQTRWVKPASSPDPH